MNKWKRKRKGKGRERRIGKEKKEKGEKDGKKGKWRRLGEIYTFITRFARARVALRGFIVLWPFLVWGVEFEE